MDQTIRFVTTNDGVKLAYAVSGSGPPLLKTANWLNHLEFDWASPVWGHWFSQFSSRNSLYRYDIRGSGLSDWTHEKLTFDQQVARSRMHREYRRTREVRTAGHLAGRVCRH